MPKKIKIFCKSIIVGMNNIIRKITEQSKNVIAKRVDIEMGFK